MKEVMHFKSSEERLNFLKGGFEEIVPKKANKPKAKKESKKTTKKGAKKDEVQAE